MKRLLPALFAIVAGTFLLTPVVAQNTRTLQLGEVKILTHGTEGGLNVKTGTWQVRLSGKGGVPVRVTSKPYDVSGKVVDLTLAGKVLRATKIVATGGVRLVSRNATTGQKLIATCDKSVYTANPGATGQGTVELAGNFRAEQYGGGFVGPLVTTGDRATFRFLPNGDLTFSTVSEDGTGTISGQPIEPPAKPKGNQP